MANTRKQLKKTHKRPRTTGWLTSDADEIERRRTRGLNERYRIETEAHDNGFFGTYCVHTGNGQNYRVEIRSLSEPINSCQCPDHRVNGLGTCKHIEATLHRLQHRQKRAFQDAAVKGSPLIEIFLDRRDGQVRIGVEAPEEKGIYRDELYQRIRKLNIQASRSKNEDIDSL